MRGETACETQGVSFGDARRLVQCFPSVACVQVFLARKFIWNSLPTCQRSEFGVLTSMRCSASSPLLATCRRNARRNARRKLSPRSPFALWGPSFAVLKQLLTKFSSKQCHTSWRGGTLARGVRVQIRVSGSSFECRIATALAFPPHNVTSSHTLAILFQHATSSSE